MAPARNHDYQPPYIFRLRNSGTESRETGVVDKKGQLTAVQFAHGCPKPGADVKAQDEQRYTQGAHFSADVEHL
jgi:hypothetical protein